MSSGIGVGAKTSEKKKADVITPPETEKIFITDPVKNAGGGGVTNSNGVGPRAPPLARTLEAGVVASSMSPNIVPEIVSKPSVKLKANVKECAGDDKAMKPIVITAKKPLRSVEYSLFILKPLIFARAARDI